YPCRSSTCQARRQPGKPLSGSVLPVGAAPEREGGQGADLAVLVGPALHVVGHQRPDRVHVEQVLEVLGPQGVLDEAARARAPPPPPPPPGVVAFAFFAAPPPGAGGGRPPRQLGTGPACHPPRPVAHP